jgi:P4 family phage/plasmid primase-like protien
MFGDEEYKPKSGRFFIHADYKGDFRELYSLAVADGYEVKLTERFHRNVTRVFLDVDGATEEERDQVCNYLETLLSERFELDNVKAEYIENDIKPGKYHIYAFTKMEGGIDRPLKINTYLYEDLVRYTIKERFPKIVDYTKSLRMIYSSKKEGSAHGVYKIGDEKDASDYKRNVKTYSIHTMKHDVVLKPTSEHQKELDMRHRARYDKKKVNRKAAEDFENTDLEERIDFILPILSEKGYLDNFSDWRAIVYACRASDYPFDKIDEICQKAKGYTDKCVERLYEDGRPVKDGYTIATLHYFLKKADAPAYDEYRKLFFKPKHGGMWLSKDILKNIYRGEIGLSGVYSDLVGDNMKIVSKKTWKGYMWDENRKLWIEKAKDEFISDIARVLSEFMEKYLDQKKEELNKINKEENPVEWKMLSGVCTSLEKVVKNCQKISVCASIFKVVKTVKTDERFYDVLNASEVLFPIKGGKIVNLKTGEIRDRVKSDYFSFESNVSEGGNAQNRKVLKFFNDVFSNDPERVQCIRNIMGYSLSADIDERKIFCLWGGGRNGKTVLFRMMNKILGEYYVTAQKEVFVKNRSQNRHVGACTPHLKPLVGKRLAVCEETCSGDRLNEDIIKNITGGGNVTCNPKFDDSFEFPPLCKLFLVTNHRLEFNARDEAILDRLVYIPFDTRFVDNPTMKHEVKADPAFIKDLLDNHIDDIFAFLLEGSLDYWKRVDGGEPGIPYPEYYIKKREEYIDEEDFFQAYFSERIIPQSDKKVKLSSLYATYKIWCTENDYIPENKKAFSDNFVRQGYEKSSKGGQVHILGIKMKTLEEIINDEEEDILGKRPQN